MSNKTGLIEPADRKLITFDGTKADVPPMTGSETTEAPLWVESLESIWAEPTPMTWLVEGLIPENSFVLIAGDSGSGKSTLALALAHATAQGRPFLNRAVSQRPVLIVDRENPRHVFCERTKRMKLEETENLHVWGLWASEEPGDPESKKIIEFVKARHPLVIFDSLIAFHPGSEQDSKETRDFLQKFRYLSVLGATVLLIHHTGKSQNSQEYRGSSDIKANVDLNFVLTQVKPRLGLLKLEPKKCREGAIEEVRITFDKESGRFVEVGDFERSAIAQIVREHPGINQKDVRTAMGGRIADHKIVDILSASVEKNLIRQEKGPCNSWRYYIDELAA